MKNLLPKNPRVVVVGETTYQWYVAYMSLLCGLGVAVPVDKELPENELENLIIRSKATAVIYSEKKKESIKKIEHSLDNVKFFVQMDSDEPIRNKDVGMK